MSGTRTRISVWLLALVVSVALVGSLFAGTAVAKAKLPKVNSASGSLTVGTTTKQGTGTVEKDKNSYDICVPFFAIGPEHSFEIKNDNKVVDTFKYSVPTADGTVAEITTAKGVKISIRTDHKAGVNGSPSKGCFEYKPAKVKD